MIRKDDEWEEQYRFYMMDRLLDADVYGALILLGIPIYAAIVFVPGLIRHLLVG